MADYCSVCQSVATARCIKDKTNALCESHGRGHPSNLLDLVRQESAIPDWAVRRDDAKLCPGCYKDSITVVLPFVVKHLSKRPEQATLQVIEKGLWAGSNSNGQIALGSRIITAVAGGRRPPWLHEGALDTLAALYVATAKTPPPLLTVKLEHATTAKSLFSSRTNLEYTTLGSFRAWTFPYSTESSDMVQLLGEHGALVLKGRIWLPNASNLILRKPGELSKADFEKTKREVKAVPQNKNPYHGDTDRMSELIKALKAKLPRY